MNDDYEYYEEEETNQKPPPAKPAKMPKLKETSDELDSPGSLTDIKSISGVLDKEIKQVVQMRDSQLNELKVTLKSMKSSIEPSLINMEQSQNTFTDQIKSAQKKILEIRNQKSMPLKSSVKGLEQKFAVYVRNEVEMKIKSMNDQLIKSKQLFNDLTIKSDKDSMAIEDKIKELEIQVQQIIKDCVNHEQNIDTKISEIVAKATNLESNFKALKEQLGKTPNHVETAANLTSAIKDIRNQIEKLYESIPQEFEKKSDELQQVILKKREEQNKKMSALREKHEIIERNNQEIEDGHNTVKDQLKELESFVVDTDKKFDVFESLKTKVGSFQKEITAYQNQIQQDISSMNSNNEANVDKLTNKFNDDKRNLEDQLTKSTTTELEKQKAAFDNYLIQQQDLLKDLKEKDDRIDPNEIHSIEESLNDMAIFIRQSKDRKELPNIVNRIMKIRSMLKVIEDHLSINADEPEFQDTIIPDSLPPPPKRIEPTIPQEKPQNKDPPKPAKESNLNNQANKMANNMLDDDEEEEEEEEAPPPPPPKKRKKQQ